MKLLFLILIFASLYSCTQPTANSTEAIRIAKIDSPPIQAPVSREPAPESIGFSVGELDSIFALNDTTWIDIERLVPNIEMDLRYATTNNFMELQIYNCPKCYLRLKAAKEVINIQNKLEEQNLGLKMFDCYRPKSAQYKLWEKKPDRRFVAPPSKGSMHSRGGALDLTIINLDSRQELDMGTEYDYFGHKAYWVHKDFPQKILNNRQLLLKTMQAFGYKTVTTEWWHFSYRRAWFKLSDMNWDC
jgi:D-alanyl-D-alanine dipeptidase